MHKFHDDDVTDANIAFGISIGRNGISISFRHYTSPTYLFDRRRIAEAAHLPVRRSETVGG